MRYQVVVGNIGTVADTDDLIQARKWYDDYVEISKSGRGRGGNENVTLFNLDEPVKEHLVDEHSAPVPVIERLLANLMNDVFTDAPESAGCVREIYQDMDHLREHLPKIEKALTEYNKEVDDEA